MDKETIKKEIERVEGILTELKEKLEKKAPLMTLRVNPRDGDMEVCIDNQTVFYIDRALGFCCSQISNHLELYAAWIASGCHHAYSSVDWKGGVYGIRGGTLKRIDIRGGGIYNFNSVCALVNCKDKNILRHAHNQRPVVS